MYTIDFYSVNYISKKKEVLSALATPNAESWECNNWLHRGTKMKGCDDWLGIQVRFHWEFSLWEGEARLLFLPSLRSMECT